MSSVDDRRVDTLADFLAQMHLAALEESPLYEILRGSTDLVPGAPVVHGPWPADSGGAEHLACPRVDRSVLPAATVRMERRSGRLVRPADPW